MQWEKDRASKASKKKKRAAARLAASFDPYPNTHGHLGPKKSKAQKKLENKQRRAQLRQMADGGDEAMTAAPSSFAEIRVMIEQFLLDDGHTTLALPPMKKHDRAMVHNLADAYQLKSKSRGKGQDRSPVLYKTARSGESVDHKRITRLVRTPFGQVDDDAFVPRGIGRAARPELAPRHREGTRVGHGAKEISEDNVGHRLLRSMGWTTGQGLGHSQGRAEPVVATLKMTRSGLGM